jgi:hypothetical protein
MTSPTEPPPNALDDARTLLHAALERVFGVVGWSKERASKYPSLTVVTPGGWVDAATVSRQGHGVIATFPIVIAVDGNDRGQVARIDAVTAAGWELFTATTMPNGSLVELLTAGPDDIDIGGPTTRAVTFSAQITLAARTLCPEALTRSDDTSQETP